MSDWSSDVCSYDLPVLLVGHAVQCTRAGQKVRDLAELTGCPILQTSGGTASIEGVEDRTFPYLFSDVGDEIVAKSYVVVTIGTELGEPSHYGRAHLMANGNAVRTCITVEIYLEAMCPHPTYHDPRAADP